MGQAPGSPLRVLHGGAIAWFVAALLSQWLFAAYIVAAYGMPLAAGTPEAMNRTHPITGHVPGDHLGNTVLLFHLLPAIWLNLAGLLQLVPRLRQRYPILHRINGRVFLILALSGALSGLLLTWVRGSRLSDIGAFGINTPQYFAIDDLRTIPEPASALLLGLGLAGLALLPRARR